MILPNVILFPQAFLPLYIFEPRYRRMLADALHTHRLFCVACQHPRRRRESPTAVAGLGLIRAARQHPDGSSHLVVQGLTRIELGPAVGYRPYRRHRINVLASRHLPSKSVDLLTARLLELVAHQLQQAAPTFPSASLPPGLPPTGPDLLSHVNNPEQITDLVSWALLTNPGQRQLLLETLDVELRLRRLIEFLLADQPGKSPTTHEPF